MQTEVQVFPNAEIYNSLNALDEYLLAARTRREQRRKVQLAIERIGIAIGKVTAELQASQQDEDTELALELQHVLQEFEAQLERTRLSASKAVVNIPPTLETQPPLAEHPKAEEPPAREDVRLEIPASVQPAISHEEKESVPSHANPPALSDDEIEAKTLEWKTEIEAISGLWNVLDSEGLRQKDNDLNRPACFRTRALACSLARVQTQADQAGLCSNIIKSVIAVRESMKRALTNAGDTFVVLPFEPFFWTDVQNRLTLEQWNELASFYQHIAEAQEAWDWYVYALEEGGIENQIALLDAIGANQQLLYGALRDYGSSDRLQNDLYNGLKDAASSIWFLKSLDKHTGWDELEDIAQSLPTLFEAARRDALDARARREKEEAKSSAVEGILQWKRRLDNAGSEVDVAKFVAELPSLLDACIAAGVPATNVKVRGAILDVAPTVLDGQPKYIKFFEAVQTARKRMQQVAPHETEETDEEHVLDAQVMEFIDALRPLVQQRSVLLFAGTKPPHHNVTTRLEDLLGCASVTCQTTEEGNSIDKFKPLIAHADIVVVAAKFVRHGMADKGREWAKKFRKKFVILPSGIGVKQIINQMHEQLVSGAARN